MSDEQPPEVGSRRRRREIRESRERERAAQQERESAVRRLSSSSTADSTSGGRTGTEEQSPALFDQETTTPKDERRRTAPKTTRTSSARSAGSAGTAGGEQGFTSRRERRLQTQQNHTVAPAEAERSTAAPTSSPTDASDALATQAISLPINGSAPQLNDPQRRGDSQPVQTPDSAAPSVSPSTPFEDVLAPRTPASPEHDDVEPDYEYEQEHEYVYGEQEDFDWDGAYDDEHIDHDENGSPILVSASGYGRGYQTVAPMEGRVNHSQLMKRRAKRRRRNITLTVALAGFATLMIAFVMIVQSLLGGEDITDYETVAGDEVEFEIYPNEGLASIQSRLVDEEIIAGSEAFQEALDDLDPDATYHAETLTLREQMPADDAVGVIFGDGVQVGYVNINAGFRLSETLEAIAAGAEIPLEELQELNENPQQFGLPDQAEDLEGFLSAGEYQPDADAEAEDVLQMIVDPTFERLEEAGVTDPDDQWDTMIIASLITAEANNTISDERTREERLEDYRIMAGAIENRLQPDQTETDGLLQIDAAVNYGLDLSGDLHFPEEERLNPENEYNTYVYDGLPPGPIGVPVADTVEAAAEPSDTDAFYWVTVNPVTGETRFNATLADHEEDTQEFLQFCQDNEGACGPGDVDAAEDDVG